VGKGAIFGEIYVRLAAPKFPQKSPFFLKKDGVIPEL
jgi:hypothetical protein